MGAAAVGECVCVCVCVLVVGGGGGGGGPQSVKVPPAQALTNNCGGVIISMGDFSRVNI